jgi:hypothetical protein
MLPSAAWLGLVVLALAIVGWNILGEAPGGVTLTGGVAAAVLGLDGLIRWWRPEPTEEERHRH